MHHFGIDSEAQEVTDEHDRLQRPWTVLIFGLLVSAATTVFAFVDSGNERLLDNKVLTGLAGFGLIALLLSVTYAVIGARVSRSMARRVVGILGGLILLAGIGLLVYALLVLAP